MSRGTNMAILIGHVGNDPKVSFSQAGTCVAKLSVATTERYKNRDGEWKDETSWHNVTIFGKAAEAVGEYVKKGRQVYVRGRIKYSKTTGQDGIEKYFTDIIADDIQFLGEGKRDGSAPQRRDDAKPAAFDPNDADEFGDRIPF